MKNLNFQEIVTILLIAIGAVVMIYAAINTRKILVLNQMKKYTKRWQILFALIAFFLLGYLAMMVVIALGLSRFLVIAAGVIFFFGALFVLLVSRISSSTIKDNLLLAKELDDERSRVDHQALDLEHRFTRLHTAVEIAHSISGVKAKNKLLQDTVDLIKNKFDLYYVGIFIFDKNANTAILQAGTGEAGKAMLTEHHMLPITDTSMVGWTVSHKQARIAMDVGNEAIRFANPHLPDTRSELALPLIFDNSVLGALTIQSDQPAAFDDDDITNLQTISNTLAIALENARLFQESQATIEELRVVQRSSTAKLWSETTRASEEFEYAASTDELASDAVLSSIDVPLILREQIIGQLHLEGQQDWSPEERALVEAVASQAALAMENARLLDESRQTALRERMAAEITGKVWASPNTEFILQTAIKELGRALHADEAIIELKTD